MSDPREPHYRLVLRPLPSEVPPAHRLRQLLKALARGWYRFRVVQVEELPDEGRAEVNATNPQPHKEIKP
jgi:hypothetical protein